MAIKPLSTFFCLGTNYVQITQRTSTSRLKQHFEMLCSCSLTELLSQVFLCLRKFWRLCLCTPFQTHSVEKMALPSAWVILHRKQQLRLFQGSKTTSTSYTNSVKSRVCLPTVSQGSPAGYICEMCFITNNHKNLGSNQQKALIFDSHIYELTGIWLVMETECGWARFQPVGWVLSSPTSLVFTGRALS